MKGTGMRVLLIEDDSATAQSIELMLKSESFNVYTTDLGEEGVDLGKLYDYDIILLDLNLPDMSGFEVLRSLRVSKVKTPILILSGLAGIEDKVKGLGFGADVYICKLRKKLANASNGKNYIETVWGRGYVLREPSEEESRIPA